MRLTAQSISHVNCAVVFLTFSIALSYTLLILLYYPNHRDNIAVRRPLVPLRWLEFVELYVFPDSCTVSCLTSLQLLPAYHSHLFILNYCMYPHFVSQCFTSPGHVALAWSDNKKDPQYEISREACEILENSTDAKGRKLSVHKIHVPPPMFYSLEEVSTLGTSDGHATARSVGRRLAASYVNCYIANKAVIVPGFGHAESDATAVKAFQELFPTRSVILIPSREIVLGGGNIHCITQQIPRPSGYPN